MIFSTLLTCLAVAPAAVWAGMYGQPVINLDAKTFKSVMATEHAAMVAFVAPWCGHCKNMAPEYTSAAQSLSPLIPFYAVDCDASQNKGLCAEYRIEGFPTVKAFPRAGKGAARDYNGERKKGAFVDFAKTLVPDRVKKLRVDDGVESVLSKFLGEKPKLPHALLIHPSTPSIPFLWKVLGHRLSSKLHLGYIRDSKSHEVLSSLGLYDATETTRDTARAVFWPAGGDTAQVVEYDGELKFNALLSWLQAHADGKDTPQDSKKQKPIKATAGSEAARQAKLDQAEKREQERRKKQGEQSGTSNVEAAPNAQPGESVSEDSATGASDQSSGGAPEPVPGSDTVPDVSEQGRVEILHEEL